MFKLFKKRQPPPTSLSSEQLNRICDYKTKILQLTKEIKEIEYTLVEDIKGLDNGDAKLYIKYPRYSKQPNIVRKIEHSLLVELYTQAQEVKLEKLKSKRQSVLNSLGYLAPNIKLGDIV